MTYGIDVSLIFDVDGAGRRQGVAGVVGEDGCEHAASRHVS